MIERKNVRDAIYLWIRTSVKETVVLIVSNSDETSKG